MLMYVSVRHSQKKILSSLQMTISNLFLAASLQKKITCHQGSKARSKKMRSIFPLCLGAFVAKFIFCKKNAP
jgi:hypothetical protein